MIGSRKHLKSRILELEAWVEALQREHKNDLKKNATLIQEKAELERRIPPFMPGDKLYYIDDDSIACLEIVSVTNSRLTTIISSSGWVFRATRTDGEAMHWESLCGSEDKIGVFYFRSREEAEKALEGGLKDGI